MSSIISFDDLVNYKDNVTIKEIKECLRQRYIDNHTYLDGEQLRKFENKYFISCESCFEYIVYAFGTVHDDTISCNVSIVQNSHSVLQSCSHYKIKDMRIDVRAMSNFIEISKEEYENLIENFINKMQETRKEIAKRFNEMYGLIDKKQVVNLDLTSISANIDLSKYDEEKNKEYIIDNIRKEVEKRKDEINKVVNKWFSPCNGCLIKILGYTNRYGQLFSVVMDTYFLNSDSGVFTASLATDSNVFSSRILYPINNTLSMEIVENTAKGLQSIVTQYEALQIGFLNTYSQILNNNYAKEI